MTPAKRKNPSPPKSLGKQGRAFWVATTESYSLEDSHHLRLLENAGVALDRAASAREQLVRDGVTVKNRFGEIVAHPAANIERQSMNAFRQNIRELGLDLSDGPVEVRGPRRPGSRN
jgi:phage terminase small subunit